MRRLLLVHCLVSLALCGNLSFVLKNVGIDTDRCNETAASPLTTTTEANWRRPCDVYISICAYSQCSTTRAFHATKNFTGIVNVAMRHETGKYVANIRFRSKNRAMDRYLLQSHRYFIDNFKHGRLVKFNESETSVFGSIRTYFRCGPGYALALDKLSCEAQQSSNQSAAATDAFLEAELNTTIVSATTATVQKEQTTPWSDVMDAESGYNQTSFLRNLCEDEQCGNPALYIVLGSILFLFLMSLTCCLLLLLRGGWRASLQRWRTATRRPTLTCCRSGRGHPYATARSKAASSSSSGPRDSVQLTRIRITPKD